MDYGKLPFTGAGIAIGGVVLDQLWLAVVAVAVVGVGAVLVRFGFRRDKTHLQP